MKRQISFIITVVLLHSYLAIAILITVFNIKPQKRPARKLDGFKIRKPQPSME